MQSDSEIIFDSGAFSVWKAEEKGESITIAVNGLADFILDNQDVVTYAASLDVIPNGDARRRKDYAKTTPSESKAHYYYLLSRGVPREILIPTYHRDEHEDYLFWMLDETDYIGLAGNTEDFELLKRFLVEAWKHIARRNPCARVHGFGMSRAEILKQYTWWSCDSTSWVDDARFGKIVVPHQIYPTKRFSVSSRGDSIKKNKNHVSTLVYSEHPEIIDFVLATGFTLEQLSEEGSVGFIARAWLNLFSYLKTAEEAGVKFYAAGNFNQLQNPLLEREMLKFICRQGLPVRRLLSYADHLRFDLCPILDVYRVL